MIVDLNFVDEPSKKKLFALLRRMIEMSVTNPDQPLEKEEKKEEEEKKEDEEEEEDDNDDDNDEDDHDVEEENDEMEEEPKQPEPEPEPEPEMTYADLWSNQAWILLLKRFFDSLDKAVLKTELMDPLKNM